MDNRSDAALLATRCVVKIIEAGQEDLVCPKGRGGCGRDVKFTVRVPSGLRRQVVVNVYHRAKWNRTEHWHLACYIRAHMPYTPRGELPIGLLPEVYDEQLQAVEESAPGCTWEEIMYKLLDNRKKAAV
jgi:hypothetical protein